MTGILNILAGSIAAAIKDGFFNLTTLLLSGDGTNGAQNNTFLDSSTNNFTITRNGNTTQGTFSPFSQTGWSNYFGGSDYLSVASATALQLSTGTSWTIEAWIYPTSITGDHGIIGKRTGGSIEWQFFLKSDRTINVYNGSTNYTSTTAISSANVWTHVAVSWDGTTLRFFINGTLCSSTYTTTFSLPAAGSNSVGIGANGNTETFTGYISNARLVKGTAVYTSSFTPSTSALTAITNTSLLTCQSNRFIDNSANAFAITVNGTPSVQAFSPFTPTAAYSAATNGASGYFDGSGDYLDIGTQTAFQIAGDFTAEMFIYVTNFSGSEQLLAGPISPGGWSMNVNNGTFGLTDRGSGYLATPANSVNKNEWVHVCFMHTAAGNDYLYINGVQRASGSGRTLTGNSTFTIGGQSGYGFYQGYISNLRIVKGSLVYNTAGFTPPTAPLSAIANTSLLCRFTNGGIFDATGKNVLETVGNAQISTTQSKFGGASISFDGAGDYLSFGASVPLPLQIGLGDFTVEFWAYLNGTGTYFVCGNLNDATGAGSYWVILNSTFTGLHTVQFGIPGTTLKFGGSTLATSTWKHVAVSRSGTDVRCFVDGVQLGTTQTLGSFTGTLNSEYRIGAAQNGALYYLNGFIDDLRISKYARYTTTFTPPTAALPLQ